MIFEVQERQAKGEGQKEWLSNGSSRTLPSNFPLPFNFRPSTLEQSEAS